MTFVVDNYSVKGGVRMLCIRGNGGALYVCVKSTSAHSVAHKFWLPTSWKLNVEHRSVNIQLLHSVFMQLTQCFFR